MAKKNAQFYFERREISSGKAIKILKKSKKINVRTRQEGLKRPIVELSTEPIEIKTGILLPKAKGAKNGNQINFSKQDKRSDMVFINGFKEKSITLKLKT